MGSAPVYRRIGPHAYGHYAVIFVETQREAGGVYFLSGIIAYPVSEQALQGFFAMLEADLSGRIGTGMAESRAAQNG